MNIDYEFRKLLGWRGTFADFAAENGLLDPTVEYYKVTVTNTFIAKEIDYTPNYVSIRLNSIESIKPKTKFGRAVKSFLLKTGMYDNKINNV